MIEFIMLDDQDLLQQESDFDEHEVSDSHSLRLKSLLLLVVLLLPMALTILEILTGRVSGWWNEKAAPLLPHIKLVYF